MDARETSSCPFSSNCHRRCNCGKDSTSLRRSTLRAPLVAATHHVARPISPASPDALRAVIPPASPAVQRPAHIASRVSASTACASPSSISPKIRRTAARSDRPSISRTCAALTCAPPAALTAPYRHGQSPDRESKARRALSLRRLARSSSVPRLCGLTASLQADFAKIAQPKLVNRNAFQVKPLAPRQHRDRHLVDFGGGEQEFHMRRRFFQRLQQAR